MADTTKAVGRRNRRSRTDGRPVAIGETTGPEGPPIEAHAEPATPPAPPVFRVVARDVVLRRRPRTDPVQPVIRGDVAAWGDRLFARFAVPGVYGVMCWGAVELSADAEVMSDVDPHTDRNWINGAYPRDHAGEIIAALNEQPGDYLSLEPPPQPTLFATGIAFCPKVWLTRRISLDVLRAFFSLHASGDWGEFGRNSDVELSAEERWLLPALSIEKQNREAIRLTQSGMAVRSRYRLGTDSAPPTRPGYQWTAYYIDVVTSISTEPVTMMSLHAEME
jgi:hypothetical protein